MRSSSIVCSRFPFDYQARLLNYFIAYAIEVVCGYTCIFILSVVNTFFFGICWIIDASFCDLVDMFQQVDKMAMERNELAQKRLLIKAVVFHSRIMRFVEWQTLS